MAHLFLFLDKFSLNLNALVPALELLFPTNVDISNKLKVPSNFRRKVATFIKKKENISKLDNPCHILYGSTKSSDFIGPLCQSISLTRKCFANLHGFFQRNKIVLTNGILLKVKKCILSELSWDDFHQMFLPFYEDSTVSSSRAFK